MNALHCRNKSKKEVHPGKRMHTLQDPLWYKQNIGTLACVYNVMDIPKRTL